MLFGKKKDTENRKRKTGIPEPGRRARGLPGIPKPAWILLGAIAGIALALFLAWRTGAALFWENPRFNIKTVTIQVEGKTMTPALIREYAGVREGQNLFSFPIGRIRKSFLEKSHITKSISIHRKLPDTLVIAVREREPIARIGRGSSLAADAEGRIFTLRLGARDLPLINGSSDRNLKPGIDADQPVRNALLVLETCHRSKAGGQIHIDSLDVSDKEAVELYLTAGERIRVAWTGMDKTTEAGRQELAKKMNHLADILRASEERGRKIVNLDLTYGDNYVPAQEY